MSAQILLNIMLSVVVIFCAYQIIKGLKTGQMFLWMNRPAGGDLEKNQDKFGFYIGIGWYCFFGFIALYMLGLNFF